MLGWIDHVIIIGGLQKLNSKHHCHTNFRLGELDWWLWIEQS